MIFYMFFSNHDFFQILHLWLRLLAVQLFPPVHFSLLQPLARLPVLRWTLCHLTPHFHVFALHPPTSQLPSCLRRTVPLPLSQCASLPFKRRLRLRCGTPCSYNKTFGSWFPSRKGERAKWRYFILEWEVWWKVAAAARLPIRRLFHRIVQCFYC